MHHIPSYNFDQLIQQASDESFETSKKAEAILLEILDLFYQQKIATQNMNTVTDYEALAVFCRQFMQLFTGLLLNPKHEFSRLATYYLGLCKPYIDIILVIIDMEDNTVIHKAIQDMADQINLGQLLGRHIMLLTPTTSITFGEDLGHSLFAEDSPVITIPAYIGAISQRLFLTEQAERFRRMVYEYVRYDYNHVLNGIDFNPIALNMAGMHISYDHKAEVRHDLRRHLNSYIKGYCNEHNIVPKPVAYTPKSRPRLTIYAECFEFEHVMYRTYGYKVMEMIKDFEVTIITNDKGLKCERMKASLEGAHFVDYTGKQKHDLLKVVEDTQPDILCYLSVGMSPESKILSQLRLAPMQLMFLGHPDSTQSEEMDFVICDYNFFQPEHHRVEAMWTERFLGIKGRSKTTEAYVQNFREENIQIKPRAILEDVVNIAIIGHAAKLNMPYINFLKRVEAASPLKVKFHFFTNVIGIEYLATTKLLSAHFLDTMVYPPQGVESYMRCVGKCDLAIGTFPFGGSNSTTDCFVSGVPMASLVGVEPHEVSEYFTHCIIGTENNLCARNEEDLLTLIMKLIEDNPFRLKMSEKVSTQSREQFDVDCDLHYFSYAIKWAYDHFEDIKQSEQRTYVLGPEELER